ncbi:histidine phosphatase superfamily [Roridomyces roridus]|uniref:Histidine phosphatase superfamily n=1 Tax=Roridomyces roridus TaxID=1738132 RepID=A0AAD7FUY0_9AGAR|nr:histidine phosphatase superfamily [Roridomyces roridus]
MAASNDTVLGVLVFTRHGDRQGFYQDPTSYTTTTPTIITPLGTAQEFQLGQLLRSTYFNASSPSFVSGVNGTLVNQTQIHVRADAGGELGVIYDSAVALLQGLFPANADYKSALANGTTVEGALAGYQYVPIESVEPTNDVSLEGYTSCNPFNDWTNAFYTTPEFLQKANDSAHFLTLLPPFLDNRPVTLQNIYNIFDFMLVNSVHNSDFAKALPPTFLEQARALANFHEYGIFTSPQLNGIGNIAGRTILPVMIQELQSIADPTNPLKLAYQSLAYKPFMSLFNMTGAAQQSPQLAGIVNYAAAVALEVREPSGGGSAVLRLRFKNGTDDQFTTYNFLGQTGDVPLQSFIDFVNPALINSTADWCTVCNNTQDRGCGAIAAAAAQANAAAINGIGHHHQRISPVGAGFLGAGLTIAVMLGMFGVLAFLGLITLGKGPSKARSAKA